MTSSGRPQNSASRQLRSILFISYLLITVPSFSQEKLTETERNRRWDLGWTTTRKFVEYNEAHEHYLATVADVTLTGNNHAQVTFRDLDPIRGHRKHPETALLQWIDADPVPLTAGMSVSIELDSEQRVCGFDYFLGWGDKGSIRAVRPRSDGRWDHLIEWDGVFLHIVPKMTNLVGPELGWKVNFGVYLYRLEYGGDDTVEIEQKIIVKTVYTPANLPNSTVQPGRSGWLDYKTWVAAQEKRLGDDWALINVVPGRWTN